MNATYQAILDSIKEWKNKKAKSHPGLVRLGTASCPLCQLFHPDKGTGANCITDCPIGLFTCQPYCIGSPYEDAEKAFSQWEDDPTNLDHKREWKEAAQKEIEFLEEIRDNFLTEHPAQ